MKFGIWHDFRNPDRWRAQYDRVYAENLEQIELAEQLGFESVWLSEHHVTDDGYMPAPLTLLGAIAARTSTMRIGTAVLLAPFQHPVRFAEDVAVLDQLSSGRVEIGLGLGYRAREFEMLDVPLAERARRTVDLIETARNLWSAGVVTPRPFQIPEPPLWLGGSSPAAARRAARLRCHYMPDATVSSEVLAIYREAFDGKVAVNPYVYVGDWSDVAEHFVYQHNRYREWSGTPTVRTPDELPRERYIVGTPTEVTQGIVALFNRTRCDRLYFWGRPPGLPIDVANRSLQRFALEVMPQVLACTANSDRTA